MFVFFFFFLAKIQNWPSIFQSFSFQYFNFQFYHLSSLTFNYFQFDTPLNPNYVLLLIGFFFLINFRIKRKKIKSDIKNKK